MCILLVVCGVLAFVSTQHSFYLLRYVAVSFVSQFWLSYITLTVVSIRKYIRRDTPDCIYYLFMSSIRIVSWNVQGRPTITGYHYQRKFLILNHNLC